MRQQDERDLRSALREEAERHRPDRDAMLDRINRGRAAYARVPTPRSRAAALLRPVAAAFAVAVVLVLAVAGVQLANREPETPELPVAGVSVAPTTTPAPAPATTAAPKPSTAVTVTSKPSRTSPAGTTPPSKAPPSGEGPKVDRDGYVASTGRVDPNSNEGWSQGNVVLASTRKLTALDISVEVALTPGAVYSGQWSTVSPDLLVVTHSQTNKRLIYRFTLRAGATLPPGEYTFAVQFIHTGRRSAGDDGYVARVTGDGKDAKVSGGFARS